ncbi:MAG: redoxin domain-containing protein [Anaerolineae bacterium]
MAQQRMATDLAPDFYLVDTQGNEIRLSDYRGKKHVLLVLNRGFI